MTADNAGDLRVEIIERFPSLSKRLRQVATHVIDHPSDFAIETLSTIAERSGVQPSTIVRFAKEFGFEGASAMQRLFRDQLVDAQPALGYRQRIKGSKVDWDQNAPIETSKLLDEFIDTSVNSLRALATDKTINFIDATVEAIKVARTTYIVGFRRSFPIAAYFGYALSKAGKFAVMLDGVGGMQRQQLSGAGVGDLVLAISFAPYADEVVELCQFAVEAGANLHVITDSDLSPLARLAGNSIAIHDPEVRGFRSLPATLCVAQSIVIGYLYATEHDG